MTAIQRSKILVIARPHANLELLSGHESPLATPCGRMGILIAKKVLEGHGTALITDSELIETVDTLEGVDAMLDNFELLDRDSQSPLLFRLLQNRL